MNTKTFTDGFSLIELLVVMAVLGIILGMAAPGYLRSYRTGQVNQGVQEFAAQVDIARAQAQRTGRCFRLEVAQDSYTVKKYRGALCTAQASDVESTQTFRAPDGTRLSPVSGSAPSADFRTPYGVNAVALPLVVRIGSLGSSDIEKQVRVTGVIGRVVVQ